jgi:membrane-associated protease RseP (regulator of RpoE activity)
VFALGLVLCLGSYFVVRRLARGWLGVRGVRALSARAEESYFHTPAARRLAWRLSGPVAAYALATALAFLMVRANGQPAPSTVLVPIEGGPAEAAGLRSGDRIVAIDGVAPSDWPDVQRLVTAAGPGRPVVLSVVREGATLSLSVTTNATSRIGIGRVPTGVVVPSVGQALRVAAAMPFTTGVNAAMALGRSVSGSEKVELKGPVAIVRELREEPGPASGGMRFGLLLLAYPIAAVWPIAPFVELLLTPRRRRGLR